MDGLVAMICDVAGVHRPGVIPLWLAKTLSAIQTRRFVWFGGEMPRIDKTAIAVLSLGQFLDDNKSREELGYRPRFTTREAVEKALRWFREQGYVVAPAVSVEAQLPRHGSAGQTL
jgi:nucleoside-diphosphate-sugar epimerase